MRIDDAWDVFMYILLILGILVVVAYFWWISLLAYNACVFKDMNTEEQDRFLKLCQGSNDIGHRLSADIGMEQRQHNDRMEKIAEKRLAIAQTDFIVSGMGSKRNYKD